MENAIVKMVIMEIHVIKYVMKIVMNVIKVVEYVLNVKNIIILIP